MAIHFCISSTPDRAGSGPKSSSPVVLIGEPADLTPKFTANAVQNCRGSDLGSVRRTPPHKKRARSAGHASVRLPHVPQPNAGFVCGNMAPSYECVGPISPLLAYALSQAHNLRPIRRAHHAQRDTMAPEVRARARHARNRVCVCVCVCVQAQQGYKNQLRSTVDLHSQPAAAHDHLGPHQRCCTEAAAAVPFKPYFCCDRPASVHHPHSSPLPYLCRHGHHDTRGHRCGPSCQC